MADKAVLHLDENFLLVAAIDFGTTYSGYAFSFKEQPHAIQMNKNWGSVTGSDSYKTPTCVMTSPDGSFHSFGYEAENDYYQLDPEAKVGGPDGYQLYRKFKMVLHNKKINGNSTIASISGHNRKALDIFQMALKFLMDHMMKPINLAVTQPIKPEDIRWVITVPAIWTDEAKGFMREAAYRAGLIPTADSTKLMIALEPEAASVFCRTLNVDAFKMSDSSKNITFGTGEKMMIVDAGAEDQKAKLLNRRRSKNDESLVSDSVREFDDSLLDSAEEKIKEPADKHQPHGGTVDITAHMIEKAGKVKEISKPSGGPWGGMQVDERFVNMLAKVLGCEFINHIKLTIPQQWLNFMTTFERSKKSTKPDGKSTIKVSLPYSFNQAFQALAKQDIETAIKEHHEKLISFANGFIVVEPDRLGELFDYSCCKTTNHITELLKDSGLDNLQYMLLVGGFAESSFLQDACEKAFRGGTLSPSFRLLVPQDAQLAILRGAVLFGHGPLEISSRISCMTYGCQADLVFEEGLHDEKRAYRSKRDGQKRCRNTFREFVKIGHSVETPEIRTFEVHPPTKSEKKVIITLYKSEKPTVMYCDEKGVSKMGEFVLTSEKRYLSENIELRVTFGHTEIQVEARDPKEGQRFPVKTSIQFLADH